MTGSSNSPFDFDALYRGESPAEGVPAVTTPPWDTKAPKENVVAWAEAGLVHGDVLDIGCGLGDNAVYLAQQGFSVTGLDISPTALITAERRAADANVNIRFAVADATRLDGYDAAFDTVIDSGMYHCLDDDAKRSYAAAVHRATRPGATLLLGAFSDANLAADPEWAAPSVSEETLRTTLDDAGWDITSLTTEVATLPHNASQANLLAAAGPAALTTLARVNLDGNQASIREAIDAGLLAGAVTLVWQAGKVLQVNELGHRDVDAKLPMQRDTIFRIASMSKPVTIAAAMALREEGKLALDEPVTKWLPELADMRVLREPTGPLDRTEPARRPITFDDLMTHRSGLVYVFSVVGPLSREYGRLPMRQDQDRWLAALAELPLAHQPGARLTYSHGTDVLGIALSRIEGKPLSQVLTERIFAPLGMSDTGFSVTPAGRRRAATMYQLDADNMLRHDVMGPPPIVDPPFCMGGAGLFSTADDYLAFARMLLAGGIVDGARVLSQESVTLMRTDRLTAEQKQYPFLGAPFWVGRGFGLNLSVVTDPAKSRQLFGPGGLGTFSWPGAYGTWWQADPSAELILLYLIQNHPEMSVDAAAVSGNTSLARLQVAQPRFVRRTYQALEI